MKRHFFPYSMMLLCLAAALYFFVRGPVSIWTAETSSSHVLGFTPDGQSIWAYHRGGGTDSAVITFQQHDVHTGKVLIEQKVTLEISYQEMVNLELVIDLLGCGKYAYLKFPLGNTQPQCKKLDLLIDLTTGQVRHLPYSGSNPGPGRYAFSPAGTWVSHHNGNCWVILDQQRTQTAFTLKHEETAEGTYFVPGRILFSPDDKHMATTWEYRDKQGAATSSEIRFYETGSWTEQSRLKMPEPGYTCLESWQGNKLWYSRCSPGNTSLNEQLIDLYAIDLSVSYPGNAIVSHPPVSHGFSRSYANPLYVREYQLLFKQGLDWHVVRIGREASQSAWLESLRNKPFLSQVINRFWPRETLALEFYRTSTQQKLNSMSIHPNSKYCLSKDGQWLAGFLQYNNQLCLYSTAPVASWPGWLFIGAFLILLFRKRLNFGR